MKLLHLLIASATAISFGAIAAGQQQGQASAQDQQQPGAQMGQAEIGQPDQETVKKVQQRLSEKGHEVGAVDGIMGSQTGQALKDFQQKEGLEQSGQLDAQTLSALGIDESAAAGATAPGTQEQDPAPGAAAPATTPSTTGEAGAGGTAGDPAEPRKD